MQMSIDIDEALLDEVVALLPGKTRSEVVNHVLAWHVQRLKEEAEDRQRTRPPEAS